MVDSKWLCYFVAMIHEFLINVPVVCLEDGMEGYVWYVRDGGNFDNDCYTIILKEGGVIRHVTSKQIVVGTNKTYKISKYKQP